MHTGGLVIKHDEIFRNGVALLAFIMAFYALVARERKTPYIVHSVYMITFIVLVSLCLSLAAVFIEALQSRPASEASAMVPVTNAVAGAEVVTAPTASTRALIWPWRLQSLSGVLLAIGLLYIIYKIFFYITH